MFDLAYLWVYVSVGLMIVIAVSLAIILYILQVREHRRALDGRSAPRASFHAVKRTQR